MNNSIKIFISALNIILGILNICKFLYYAGHYYNFLYPNLLIGIICIIIGKNLLKSLEL